MATLEMFTNASHMLQAQFECIISVATAFPSVVKFEEIITPLFI